jgi:hypothetical protein
VAEPFELRDESFGDPVGVGTAGEVVAAEVLVGDVVLEDVVGGDQDRVGDGDDWSSPSAVCTLRGRNPPRSPLP